MTTALMVLLAVLGLLSVPLSLNYRLHWLRTLNGECRLRWLFGLVNVNIPISTERKQVAVQRARARQPKKRGSFKPVNALRQAEFRRRLARFAKALWRAIDRERLRLHARIGLGDPADTGQLWAVLGPLSAWLSNLRAVSVSIEPDFIESVLEVNSSGRIRLVPLQLLYLLLGLLLSPAFWVGLRQARPTTS